MARWTSAADGFSAELGGVASAEALKERAASAADKKIPERPMSNVQLFPWCSQQTGKACSDWRNIIDLGNILSMKITTPILGFLLLTSACSKQPERACSPPLSTWRKPGPFFLVVNKIAVDRTGATYWNGKPISAQTLDKYLSVVPTMNPIPAVFLETEMGAPCASVDAVRKKMEERLGCSHGGPCAEGIMDVWENTPLPPGTPPA
jgi:hypothetical protein